MTRREVALNVAGALLGAAAVAVLVVVRVERCIRRVAAG